MMEAVGAGALTGAVKSIPHIFQKIENWQNEPEALQEMADSLLSGYRILSWAKPHLPESELKGLVNKLNDGVLLYQEAVRGKREWENQSERGHSLLSLRWILGSYTPRLAKLREEILVEKLAAVKIFEVFKEAPKDIKKNDPLFMSLEAHPLKLGEKVFVWSDMAKSDMAKTWNLGEVKDILQGETTVHHNGKDYGVGSVMIQLDVAEDVMFLTPEEITLQICNQIRKVPQEQVNFSFKLENISSDLTEMIEVLKSDVEAKASAAVREGIQKIMGVVEQAFGPDISKSFNVLTGSIIVHAKLTCRSGAALCKVQSMCNSGVFLETLSKMLDEVESIKAVPEDPIRALALGEPEVSGGEAAVDKSAPFTIEDKADLECVICHEWLSITAGLQCHHKFCMKCLNDLFGVKRDSQCPVCRDHITVEPKFLPGVDAQVNMAIKNFYPEDLGAYTKRVAEHKQYLEDVFKKSEGRDRPNAHGLENYYLFIGNPGAGKSALINAFLGKLEFASRHRARGVTEILQAATSPAGVFLDTPGLNDEKKRKEAAQAISEALQKEGFHRLFFVLDCSGGRADPGDKALINLVIQACKKVEGFRYSVIFNKVKAKTIARHRSDKEEDKERSLEWQTDMFSGLDKLPTTYTFAIRREELDEEDDVLFEMPEDLRQWITDAPQVLIRREKADALEEKNYENMIQMFAKKIEDIRASFEHQLREQQEIVKKLMEEKGQWEKLQAQNTYPTPKRAPSGILNLTSRFSANDEKPQKLCRFWVQHPQMCKHGMECEFAHGVMEMKNPNRNTQGVTRFHHTGLVPTRMCWYEPGTCTAGLRCGFAHSKHEMQRR
mmetsp:Transcript_81639/g.149148  ORF Transcript_81639/g.149148 Transcript_81639/m.149148 type:complete len:835 (+) Transcript_81639:124-2628(+)